MYTTIKVRLKITEEEKRLFLNYETLFHQNMKSIVGNMIHNGNMRYNQQIYDTSIDLHSHWNLYQLSLRKYKFIQLHKRFQYTRSSTWNPNSFSFNGETIVFYFGSGFKVFRLEIAIIVLKQFNESIRQQRIIRLDILHDEKFWYANIVFSVEYIT